MLLSEPQISREWLSIWHMYPVVFLRWGGNGAPGESMGMPLAPALFIQCSRDSSMGPVGSDWVGGSWLTPKETQMSLQHGLRGLTSSWTIELIQQGPECVEESETHAPRSHQTLHQL